MRLATGVALVLLTSACGEKPARVYEPTRVYEPGRWEPIFFESIDERTRSLALTPLRDEVIPKGSVEIRIWGGFGLQAYFSDLQVWGASPPRLYWLRGHPVEGLRLRKDRDRYSGWRYPRFPRIWDVEPKSGWEDFWRSLERAGVYDLPDSEGLEGHQGILDGICYVVEFRNANGYCTYEYGNPQSQDHPEAKRFMRMLELLRAETGFDTPSRD